MSDRGMHNGQPYSNETSLHTDYFNDQNLSLLILSPDGGFDVLNATKLLLGDKNSHPHLLTSPHGSSMFSDDHFLIQSLDGNVFDPDSTGNGAGHELGGHHTRSESILERMDFLVPDDLGEQSRAFPPLSFPQNTPSLAARGCTGVAWNLASGSVQSPVLPSQSQTSYNQEHLYHKQQQQLRQQAQMVAHTHAPKHFHPDAIFSPLVSPAGTPLNRPINVTLVMAPHREFEPLTSPALKAELQVMAASCGLSSMSSSDHIGPLSTLGSDNYSSGNSTRRKTSHQTPSMQTHAGSKHSRSPLLEKGPPTFEKLPETSYEPSSLQGRSSESTPMLPPQVKRVPVDHSSSLTPVNIGPGPMMGFTMNRLAEQQGKGPASISLGSTASDALGKPRTRTLPRTPSQRSIDYSGKAYALSLSETSPVLDTQSDLSEYLALRNSKIPAKKTSHKLAEQGRRNRMSKAISELASLIPSSYHDKAQIPSKATTVELASEYIATLLKDLDELKLSKVEKESRT